MKEFFVLKPIELIKQNPYHLKMMITTMVSFRLHALVEYPVFYYALTEGKQLAIEGHMGSERILKCKTKN